MGATTFADFDFFPIVISIHAPVWGRLLSKISDICISIFQSTPPYGGDLEAHEETVGAEDFNPRPRMGATAEHGNNHRVIQFQSTPPYGGDDKTYYGVGYQQDFNPRPRMGATVRRDSTIFSVTLVLFRESHLQYF